MTTQNLKYKQTRVADITDSDQDSLHAGLLSRLICMLDKDIRVLFLFNYLFIFITYYLGEYRRLGSS